MVRAVLASSLSCDFSRARRAASFTSLNFSANLKRGQIKCFRLQKHEKCSTNKTLDMCNEEKVEKTPQLLRYNLLDFRWFYLVQLLLCSKAQTVHSVGPAVSPLTKLLGRLGKCHAGCDGAVDNRLQTQRKQRWLSLQVFIMWIKVKVAGVYLHK